MASEPRVTLQTLRVLKVLLSDPLAEHYGLEIAHKAGLKSGTIYPLLARLEASGWVTSDWEEIDPVAAGRRPRRYYKLSTDGAERARRHLREAEWLITQTPSPGPTVPGPSAPRPGDTPA